MKKEIFATLVTIGDELLIGQVIDTNSSYIARKLNSIGVSLKRRIAIGDKREEIRNVLDSECDAVDLILITGGLGPTSDDITKKSLGEYFNSSWVLNEVARRNVVRLFTKKYQKPVSEVNLAQAEVPSVCEVIQNKRGTAPAMIFRKGKTMIVSMPGVPYEMQGILNTLIPIIQKTYKLPSIIHRTLLTSGIGESALAEMLIDFEKYLPRDIRLAYLPNLGMLRLRLSTTHFGNSKESAIHSEFSKLKKLVKDYLVTGHDEMMQEVVGKLLRKLGKTLSTAESCTGGAIAALVTSVPGSSAYFQGSVVSYSNEVKEKVLGVKQRTLEKYGAVSEQVVKEMLQGVLKKMNTDYGIAVSGIMGPGGGSAEKPIGTVWVAVGSSEACETVVWHQRYERAKNIEVTSVMALNMLRRFVLLQGKNS